MKSPIKNREPKAELRNTACHAARHAAAPSRAVKTKKSEPTSSKCRISLQPSRSDGEATQAKYSATARANHAQNTRGMATRASPRQQRISRATTAIARNDSVAAMEIGTIATPNISAARSMVPSRNTLSQGVPSARDDLAENSTGAWTVEASTNSLRTSDVLNRSL